MEIKLRTTRTLKVTEVRLTDEQMAQLADLSMDTRYETLLDVMERACIELETAHLNTDVGSPEAVLGGHCMAKAVWLFFAYVQKQVLNARHTRTGGEEHNESPSLDDVLQGVN